MDAFTSDFLEQKDLEPVRQELCHRINECLDIVCEVREAATAHLWRHATAADNKDDEQRLQDKSAAVDAALTVLAAIPPSTMPAMTTVMSISDPSQSPSAATSLISPPPMPPFVSTASTRKTMPPTAAAIRWSVSTRSSSGTEMSPMTANGMSMRSKITRCSRSVHV